MAEGEKQSESESEEIMATSIEQELTKAPCTEESASQLDSSTLTLWSAAALMETLALVGGVVWIMSGPGGISMFGRVAIVALVAVLGGGAFVIAAARRIK